MTKKVKLSDVARDLQISTQELIGFYQERDANGNTKKGVTGLTPEEINLALEYYSQKSQVESLDAYFASKDTRNRNRRKSRARRNRQKRRHLPRKSSRKRNSRITKSSRNPRLRKRNPRHRNPKSRQKRNRQLRKQLSPSRTMRRSMKSPKSSRQRHRNTASVSM